MTINDRLVQIEYQTEVTSDHRPFTSDDKAEMIWLFNEHERLVRLGYANGFTAEMALVDKLR